jgi:hypothetical protein
MGCASFSVLTVKVGSTVMTFRISYKGGTGNDVAITRVA